MKTDIRELGKADFRDALKSLEQIRSVRYRYKQEVAEAAAHPGVRPEPVLHLGVIAQSLPDPVKTENKQLGIYDMSLNDMVGFLVETVRGVHGEAQDVQHQADDIASKLGAGIEQLQQQNTDQQQVLASQAQRLTDLETRLKAIEAAIAAR